MDWYQVHGSNDFIVPSELDGLEVLSPSTEDWFQWEMSGFENAVLPRKYSATSEKENLTNLKSDTRVPPLKESKVPQVHLGESSSSSSPCEDGLLFDCSMRTSDDLFNDLPDFEIQTSMQNVDDIFLDSFPVMDLMQLENPYELMHIPESMHPPWTWRISILEGSDTFMKDSAGREDADPNFGAAYIVDPSPISEGFIANVADEPVCVEAIVLKELQNVMLQLNSKTRISIRDALYRLANSARDKNANLCQSGSFMDLPSHSELFCGTSRQELKTNEIDRAIAALMFDRRDYRLPEFPSSHRFLKNKEAEAASGLGS